ncbi:hypothetical protein PVK06_035563 [Gossypium arboreum]|uniref:Uncharacterized protein n=1 Tax=Gossypium arboreum TaxID=29729 RepID=A0ABR0NJD2_GOSAR|nr:hypothetical protein PVK06_035563 [Gossypium arboreum]
MSDWGGRLELEIDRKARIWARLMYSLREFNGGSTIDYRFFDIPFSLSKTKMVLVLDPQPSLLLDYPPIP